MEYKFIHARRGTYLMLRMATVLLCFAYSLSLSAITNHELMSNLSTRLNDLPEGRGTLIKSFNDHSQSYIYDQALAIIAYTKENDRLRARKLMQGLKTLQMSDGSLYFSYYMDGKSPYPQEGDKRIAGAISWVALAAIHYQHKFKTKEFLVFNLKILNYLQTQILPIEINGIKHKALAFAPNDVPSTHFPENDVAALEHNLDAYAAFLHFQSVNGYTKWDSEVSNMKKFILSMWDKDRSYFWSGASFKNSRINKSELYLDNQTWTLLALDRTTLQQISPQKALDHNCDVFYVKHDGINGFMDSKPTRRPASHEFVWAEGTLGQILAMSKINKIKNQAMTCNRQSSNDILASIKKMKKKDGGIAYATKNGNPDFTNSSSVAGTVWMYFASNDFNPFQIDGLN